jgi:phenylacetate-CoA ligase
MRAQLRLRSRDGLYSFGMSIHLERSPLMTAAGERMVRRLREHPDAPRFNYATGDRLRPEDLDPIARFREQLHLRRAAGADRPPAELLARFERLRRVVPFLREHVPAAVDLARDWDRLPTTSRADLALYPWRFVPDDEPLERLIIYRTAGTTGHPISVPHHPLAVRCYEPLIEFALERHGVRLQFDPNRVACFLVGAQIRTYTYATVLYNWNGAGFAKLNIRPTEWPQAESQHRYFREFAPSFLSGDPISFAEMMRMDIPAQPTALLTTSVALSPVLKARLTERYRCPVIDWYSMVETGPLGYACPLGHGYHLLPHDVFAEVLLADGTPAPAGVRGEIVVSGGRNPLFPLFRYRTGDFGRMDFAPCPCGDPQPRFMELEGRQPVLIRADDGTPVSTVDLSRLLREFPLLLHEFEQRADWSCELVARPLPNVEPDAAAIEAALCKVLGAVPLSIRFDATLGDRTDGKATPYRSALMVED